MIRRSSRISAAISRRQARLQSNALLTLFVVAVVVIVSLLALNQTKQVQKNVSQTDPADFPQQGSPLPSEAPDDVEPMAVPEDKSKSFRTMRTDDDPLDIPRSEPLEPVGSEPSFIAIGPGDEIAVPNRNLADFVTVPVFLGTNRARSTPPTLGGGMLRFFAEMLGIVSLLTAVAAIVLAALIKGREWA